MSEGAASWLALDVGGANLKAAHSCGAARALAFPLWKAPEQLAERLAALARRFPPSESLALTMTGELCDCFETKAEGVRHIVLSVESAIPGRPLNIWGVDGRFHDRAAIFQDPWIAAASNWVALARVAARQSNQRALLIDIGSTTSDVIVLANGREQAIGRIDSERLQSGELVYLGVKRTPLCALGREVRFKGRTTGLCAELFATTLDVFLMLGAIAENPDDHETADGRPSTIAMAVARLARMVGQDSDQFTAEDALDLARQFRVLMIGLLVRSARQVIASGGASPSMAIISGSGEFLAREVASQVIGPGGVVVSLGELWGSAASEAACARALLELVPGTGGE